MSGMSKDKRAAMEERKARRPAGPAPGSGLALCWETNRVMEVELMAYHEGHLYDPEHAPKGARPYQEGDDLQDEAQGTPKVSASAVKGLPSSKSKAKAPAKKVGSRAAKRKAKAEPEPEPESSTPAPEPELDPEA